MDLPLSAAGYLLCGVLPAAPVAHDDVHLRPEVVSVRAQASPRPALAPVISTRRPLIDPGSSAFQPSALRAR